MNPTPAEPTPNQQLKSLQQIREWWDEEARAMELNPKQTSALAYFVTSELSGYQDQFGNELWTTPMGRNIREDIIHSALSKLS